MKVYRGNAAAARHYVEADHGHGHAAGHSRRGRADDYYLAEGTGLADRFVATRNPTGEGTVTQLATLDGDAYETWVAGLDPDTGVARGRLRADEQGVRFVEVTVNGPKSWSLAAALHPDIADAYDAAQDAAASEIIGWLAEHATTRVGPRGRQVQVPVERIEAVTVRHYTSRAGDPHRHLHLQVNARVFAAGKWRGLHTVGVRDSIDAINGIGHAAMMTNPAFRRALATHGMTLDPDTGEVKELTEFVGPFSARARQIAANVETYEAEWRAAHPGQEPGPQLYRSWDARAWARARPDKIIQADGAELTDRWVTELRTLGYHDPEPTLLTAVEAVATRPGELDREEAVAVILTRLGAKRSAWNHADIRGEAERLIARHNIVTDKQMRLELAEDLTARTLAASVPLLTGDGTPEHVRAWSSRQVLAVEADITGRLAARSSATPGARTRDAGPTRSNWRATGTRAGVASATRTPAPSTTGMRAARLTREQAAGLDPAQARVAATIAGERRLVVVEGAAGAGKTTTLAAASAAIAADGRRLVVVTPTLKAAQVAARELNNHPDPEPGSTPSAGQDGQGGGEARAFSGAWLAVQHGYRWDEDGKWFRLPPEHVHPRPEAVLQPGDVLLVDEAGMLDQDTARALLTIADEAGARLALVGDRYQLPAVGRGGVLDLAARWADPEAVLTLDTVRRFSDPDYAAITLSMRTGERLPEHLRHELATIRAAGDTGNVGESGGGVAGEVFDLLAARGQIVLHETEVDRTRTLAAEATEGALVIADTREQVADLSAATRDHHLATGTVDDGRVAITDAGERIGVGDKIATRANDYDLGVANRDTWRVTGLTDDGGLQVVSTSPHQPKRGADPKHGARALPADYVRTSVELAYAATVYGAQGDTVDAGHLAMGEHTGAASAYVAMTRGRHGNTAHIIAETMTDARRLWVEAFGRDRADLGPTHAAARAAEDVDRYGIQVAPPRLLDEALADLHAAWKQQRQLHTAIRRAEQRRSLALAYGADVVLPGEPSHDENLDQITGEIAGYKTRLAAAKTKARTIAREPALAALGRDGLQQEMNRWSGEQNALQAAVLAQQQAAQATEATRRHRLGEPTPYSPASDRGPERGRGGIGR
ncbi:MobF family relaxase [Nocardioides humi]|uniref:MobF family relaxase n=1 Tax=Nocardioides humi TaxID=449461 RepID=UPI00112C7C4E|nr:MobF family relaxase [Nocardioides humi]